jgi:small-conductance mechanosensitive channel
MTEIDKLVSDLGQPGVPLRLAVLAACLLLAFVISWAIGRGRSPQSVWFGRAIFDGLLFPLLALVLSYSAMLALGREQPVAVFRIAIPILISFAGIRFLARVLAAVFPASATARLVERLFSWLAWVAAVLWIIGLLPAVMAEMDAIRFSFGKSHISLLGLAEGLLSCGVVMVLALWISATVERRVLRETVTDLSLRKVAANAVRATLLLVGLLFALSAVGVDLTALSVLGGALGVGLGFGLQKLAANYVSGFVILFERSLRIGDNVKVDGFEGRITDIKTRYTLIRAGNGRESIVPNEQLISQRVENLSLADQVFNITTNIVVGYDSDTALVQQLLCAAAASQPRVLAQPAPVAYLVGFPPDGMEFSLHFWIADPQAGQLNVRSDINIALLQALRGAGVDIPFPQRVVHLPAAVSASAKEAKG